MNNLREEIVYAGHRTRSAVAEAMYNTFAPETCKQCGQSDPIAKSERDRKAIRANALLHEYKPVIGAALRSMLIDAARTQQQLLIMSKRLGKLREEASEEYWSANREGMTAFVIGNMKRRRKAK